jgi:hypothetical protein
VERLERELQVRQRLRVAHVLRVLPGHGHCVARWWRKQCTLHCVAHARLATHALQWRLDRLCSRIVTFAKNSACRCESERCSRAISSCTTIHIYANHRKHGSVRPQAVAVQPRSSHPRARALALVPRREVVELLAKLPRLQRRNSGTATTATTAATFRAAVMRCG